MAENKAWILDGQNCSHPGVLADWLARQPGGDELPLWQRANSFECPQGQFPGLGWLLMSRDRAKQVERNDFIELEIKNDQHGDVKLKGLIQANQPLSMFGREQDGDSPMLVCVADRRLVAQRACINRGYNVPMPAPSNSGVPSNIFYPETLNGNQPWSWQTMLNDIWKLIQSQTNNALGVQAPPTLPVPASVAPTDLRFFGMSAWDALHAALYAIGLTTAFDPISDAFAYVHPEDDGTLGAAVGALASRHLESFDPEPGANAGRYPKKICVFFPKRSKWFGIERDTTRESNWEADPVYKVELDTGIPNARGIRCFVSDVYALFNHDGEITLGSRNECQDRAQELLHIVSRDVDLDMKHVFSGPVSSIRATSRAVEQITWRDYGDDRGQVTIIERLGATTVKESFSSKLRSAMSELSPAHDPVKPGDWGRRSHPVWPREMQVVQIYNTGAPLDEIVSPIGATLLHGTPQQVRVHPGRVRLIRAGLEVMEDCWITVLSDFDQFAGDIDAPNGSFYHGRLSGTAAASGRELPIYSVEHVISPYALICFKLLDDRSREQNAQGQLFGRARAVVQAVYGDSRLVKDDVFIADFCDRLYLGAVEGCEGLALDFGVRGADPSEQEQDSVPYLPVIECQELSAWIEFETYSNRATGAPEQDIACKVIDYFGFANAVFPPGIVNQHNQNRELVVRFLAGTLPKMQKGATGFAFFNVQYDDLLTADDMRYQAVISDQLCLLLGMVNEKFCSGQKIRATDQRAMTFWPFGQEPQGAQGRILVTAENPLRLSSLGNDTIAAFDFGVDKFVGVNTEHIDVTLATGKITFKNCKALVWGRTFSQMTCEEHDRVIYEWQWYPMHVVQDFVAANLTGSGQARRCTIKANAYELCFPEDWNELTANEFTVIEFKPTVVLRDVDVNGLCFEGLVGVGWEPDGCSVQDETVVLFCGELCATSSS